jgi:hypothetical protein
MPGMLQRIMFFLSGKHLDWRPETVLSPVTTLSGEKITRGLSMRRWHDGQWEYRHPTPDEAADHSESTAW